MNARLQLLVASTALSACVEPVTLTVEIEGDGAVDVLIEDRSPRCTEPRCQYDVRPTDLVTLGAVPAPGARFVGWGGACADERAFNLCDIVVEEATLVTARFEPE